MTVRATIAAAALAALPIGAPALAEEQPGREMATDPAVYGGSLNFEVLREGSEFGYHRVDFSYDGEDLIVTSDIELKVKLGPVTAFYYKLDAIERWQDGYLAGASATSRKDGEDLRVEAIRDGSVIVVDGTDYAGPAPLEIIPSSHWNMAEMAQSQMLSLETGELLPVEITHLGTETILAGGEMIEAERYHMDAELPVDFWYDADGRWVKCAFEARGQSIEYVLVASGDQG